MAKLNYLYTLNADGPVGCPIDVYEKEHQVPLPIKLTIAAALVGLSLAGLNMIKGDEPPAAVQPAVQPAAPQSLGLN